MLLAYDLQKLQSLLKLGLLRYRHVDHLRLIRNKFSKYLHEVRNQFELAEEELVLLRFCHEVLFVMFQIVF